jgi:hypothetical protein
MDELNGPPDRLPEHPYSPERDLTIASLVYSVLDTAALHPTDPAIRKRARSHSDCGMRSHCMPGLPDPEGHQARMPKSHIC